MDIAKFDSELELVRRLLKHPVHSRIGVFCAFDTHATKIPDGTKSPDFDCTLSRQMYFNTIKFTYYNSGIILY